jgi:predicted RNase H-like HicB family nuclease
MLFGGAFSWSDMSREFNVIVERDEEGWYVGRVPELTGCHTQARSLDKLMVRMKEAIEVCIESGQKPQPVDFIGIQRLMVTQ